MNNNFLSEAQGFKNELIELRRELHRNAETGFELPNTIKIVKDKLTEYGCEFTDCGKSGVVCVIGKSSDKKAFLLRADMDALSVNEQTGLDYACDNGNMHACGHDMHTAMLLGAAKLLKNHENELSGQVKLMFQPAEEILSGAKNMLDNGVLSEPQVGGAFMLHVIAGVPLESGAVIVSAEGVGAPAADYFTINIKGKGCHGSMPQQGVDSLTVAAHILLGLQEISARELGVSDEAVITIGSLHGGNAGNVIADSAHMHGTIRSFDDEIRSLIKKRIIDISKSIAEAYRAGACVTFTSGCPSLINDGTLSSFVLKSLPKLLGDNMVIDASSISTSSKGGSEDFSYVSRQVPSLMVALLAGEPENGFSHPQHHPKVLFDEDVLPTGAAVYAFVAAEWLKDK